MSLNEMLFVAAGLVLGIALTYSYKIIARLLFTFKMKRVMQKGFNDKKKELEKFKKEGGMHKWVNGVSVRLPNGQMTQTHACELTGYCPALDGFLDVNQVKAVAAGRKQKEEFEDFREAEINEIQRFYSIPDSDIDGLVSKIEGIGKKFQIQKINDFKEKLQKQYSKDVKIVSNMDELNEALKEAQGGKS